MILNYHKKFIKKLKRLNPKIRDKIFLTLDLFTKDPLNTVLRNHALKGQMSELRSISISFDLRIIFMETDNYTTVILLDIGSHDGVY